MLRASLGREPAHVPAAELVPFLRANGLGTGLVEGGAGLQDDPDWKKAVRLDAIRAATRQATVAQIVSGLGDLAPRVAWDASPWRTCMDSFVRLIAPMWALDDVAERLRHAGLVRLPGWDSATSRSLARIADGRGVDRVELVDGNAGEIEPGDGTLGRLKPAAAARRTVAQIWTRGVVRIADLADLDMPGTLGAAWTGPLSPPLTAREAGGLQAVRRVRRRLEAGAVSLPVALQAGELGLVETARRAARRLGVAARPPYRVALSGIEGSGTTAHARALTTSLQNIGVEATVVPGHPWSKPQPASRSTVARLWRGTLGKRGGVVVFDTHVLDADVASRCRSSRLVAGLHAALIARLAPQADITFSVVVDPLARTCGSARQERFERARVSDLLSPRVKPLVEVEGDGTVTACADRILRSVLAEYLGELRPPHERNATWRILLPADPGGAVALVDLEPGMIAGFRRSYPDAVVVTRQLSGTDHHRAVLWDGTHLPLDQSALGLVVYDQRAGGRTLGGPPAPARAVIVSSRRRYDVALYPHPDHLQSLVWPWSPTTSGSLRGRLGELCSATPAWGLLDRAGLVIDTGQPGIAADVLEAVLGETGRRGRPMRCYASTGDVAVLRVNLDGDDAAVRIGLTAAGAQRIARHQAAIETLRARASSGGVSHHLPNNLASGTVHGHLWMAEAWRNGRTGPGGLAWRRGGHGWEDGRDFASKLAAQAPTGTMGPGWSREWAGPMGEFGPEVALLIEGALRPMETSGAFAAWCHGDLWPGNIVLDRHGGPLGVVDWEQSRSDGPRGIDGVFLETYRLSSLHGISFGATCAHLLNTRLRLSPAPVPGWDWAACDLSVQRALVLSALVLQAQVRDRGDPSWVRQNMDPVVFALTHPWPYGRRALLE